MRSISMTAVAAAMVFMGMVSPAAADNVTGENRLLCTVAEANFCYPGLWCEHGPAWLWNVPDFIEIDLTKKELRTTKASGLNRMTPIISVKRVDGDLLLAGTEQGKSYVFSIREDTGELTATVAARGHGGVGFGVCTAAQQP